MPKGLLYFARNSAFQHLIKIGKTTLSFEDRGLSASNVPEPFEAIAVFECEDINWVEKRYTNNLNNLDTVRKYGIN